MSELALVRRARRAVMRAATRHGVEGYLKHARALTDPGLRRDLRDHRAMLLVLALAVRPEAHAIDVGAHEGAVLRELVRLAPRGRQLAFEPIPELREGLERDFGRVASVEISGLALSDTNGESTFQHVVTAPGLSGLRRRAMPAGEQVRQIKVRTARLDDALPEGFVPALLKIDVEGAELLVLRGAVQTLARYRPVVLFEHGQGGFDQYGARPRDLHDLLVRDCSLRIFDLAGEGPYSRDHFEAVFDQPIWNFVACP